MKRCIIALLMTGLLWGGAGPLCAQNSGDDRELFLPAKVSEAALPADLDTYAESYRPIRLNWWLLDPHIPDPRVVQATLAPRRRCEILLERVEVRAPDDFTWRGSVVGEEGSEFTLTCYKDAAALDLRGPQTGQYMLRCLQNSDVMLLCAVRQDIPNRCGVTEESPPLPAAGGVGAQGTTTVRVMIVYNADVRNLLGGENAAHAAAQNAIDVTNNCMSNSDTNTQVSLVHTETISFTENDDYDTMLTNLSDNAYVASLRNDYAADLIDLLTSRVGGNGTVVGKAQLPLLGDTPISDCGNIQRCHSVSNYATASSDLTVAHELGHNFGCGHGYGDGGLYSYSQGYRFDINGVYYRTVMAYDETGIFRLRVNNYSNPDINFTGTGGVQHATGDADHNNARTIRITTYWLSIYRAFATDEYVNGDTSFTSSGRVECPWTTVADGLRWLVSGVEGNIYLGSGHYNEPMTITRPVTLQRYFGEGYGLSPAVIGRP